MLLKILCFLITIPKRFFLDLGFVSKKLLKMIRLGVVVSTSLRICEECDFEQHSIVFAIFSRFEASDFRPWKRTFSRVFSKVLLGGTLERFGTIWVAKWKPNCVQSDDKYVKWFVFFMSFSRGAQGHGR